MAFKRTALVFMAKVKFEVMTKVCSPESMSSSFSRDQINADANIENSALLTILKVCSGGSTQLLGSPNQISSFLQWCLLDVEFGRLFLLFAIL